MDIPEEARYGEEEQWLFKPLPEGTTFMRMKPVGGVVTVLDAVDVFLQVRDRANARDVLVDALMTIGWYVAPSGNTPVPQGRQWSFFEKDTKISCEPLLTSTAAAAVCLRLNTLAHATIDVSDEALAKEPDREIGFVYYREGERRVKQVTPDMATDFNAKPSKVHTNLIELGRIVGVVI